jgi:hypothetical protein
MPSHGIESLYWYRTFTAMMAVVAVMADTTTVLFFVMGVVVGARFVATSHQ